MNEALVALESTGFTIAAGRTTASAWFGRNDEQHLSRSYLGQPPAPRRCARTRQQPAPANNTNTGGDAKQQAEPPAPPPKDGVTMDIDQSDPTKVAVTVTNTSPLDGNCTYDAKKTAGLIGQQDVNKTFSLAPGAGTTLTFPAVPLGSTYHVVVSCHGTFNGQDDEFGRKEQDVSAKL